MGSAGIRANLLAEHSARCRAECSSQKSGRIVAESVRPELFGSFSVQTLGWAFGPNSGRLSAQIPAQSRSGPLGAQISQNIQPDLGPKVKPCKELTVSYTKYEVITNLVLCIYIKPNNTLNMWSSVAQLIRLVLCNPNVLCSVPGSVWEFIQLRSIMGMIVSWCWKLTPYKLCKMY